MIKKFLFVPFFLVTLTLQAQVPFEGRYSENFDSLPVFGGPRTPTAFSFVNNETLLGWYSSVGTGTNNARSSAGAQAGSGDLYNWGAVGSSDRALGLFSAEGYKSPAFLGVQLKNETGKAIDSLTISFEIKQWRQNQNPVSWEFGYLVTPEDRNELDIGHYTLNPKGNASSHLTGNASGANGSAEVRQVTLKLDDLKWKAGEYLWLRWSSNQKAESCGIGLDNLEVKATP